LLAFVVLFAMYTVNIPLTVFTLFGGALAIGVGFGAQNLINNFISGLIMLLERPIKVGDIVDVDGVRGRVSTIGARCSHVRRFDGIEMLVPNSAFLEKNVTNWTLSDRLIRFSVTVGVAYGSPVRDVSKLMMMVLEEHGKILKYPEPLVLFEDFGESALVFTSYYWIELAGETDSRIVASDIRFRIDRLFREAGISIAFPQRDIHLDGIGPVDVRIVGMGEQAYAGDSAADDGPILPEAKGRRPGK
jgi:potassium-dependent mechanosensitive channel